MAAASESISVLVTTKSESGVPSVTTVAVTADVDYTVYPPPPGSSEKPAAAAVATGADKPLTPAQAGMHKEVLVHFQNMAYRIPGVRNGKLEEEEKFWLVRLPFSFLFFFLPSWMRILIFFLLLFVVMVQSLMIACYGEN